MLDLTYHHADQIFRNSQGHGLFIGDCTAAEDLDWIKDHNIRTVLTVAKGFKHHYDPSVRHIVYDMQDRKNENISAHFESAASQIDKNLRVGSVLVHCGAGISRSSTLVIAYLIKFKSMSFINALKLCKSKRPQICPNLGFELQLKAYEKMLQTTAMLIQPRRKVAKQLPELLKYTPFSTFNKSFMKQSSGRMSNSLLSKSLRPSETREKKEVELLRKMAQFRFGLTNMQRWKMTNESWKPSNV